MKEQSIIPLFPLDVVLFPYLPLPLHIFEERYKIMIQDCLQAGQDFGVVYARRDKMEQVGCTAKIIQVVRKYDDGRMDLMTQGNARFRIDKILSKKLYLQARIRFFDDDDSTTEADLHTLVKTGTHLLENLEKISINRMDLKFVESLSDKVISYILTGIAGFSMDQKQYFLEMTSTAERLRQGIEQLKQIVAHAHLKESHKNPVPEPPLFRKFSLN
jgi:Lon protease-like protein